MIKNTTTILLLAGILLLVNVLSNQFSKRFDLTRDGQYTLSNATRNILQELEEPVTISAYISEDMPTSLQKTRNDFRDLLIEYGSLSNGMV
ncbi:MAG: Gldg family protein, partial [Bacteroidota bacterium]